jgi:RNA polymerase sigma-70 factor (ECF subfamily)
LACLESLQRYSGEGTFRAFLYGIARNVLREFIRKQVRARQREQDPGEVSVADLAPGASTQAAVRSEMRVLLMALQALPTDLQTLLELYYWEELSVDELGHVLQVPSGTIKSRLHRARGLLREAMHRVPAEGELRHSTVSLYADWLGSAESV